jgi:TolB-like protein
MTNDAPRSGFGEFLAEIRRRRVVRFSLGYAAAAFVALQLAEIVFPAFGFGEGAIRVLVVAVALGFLPSIVLAWLYDVTAEGIRRTQESATSGPEPRRLSVLAFSITTIVVTGGVAWYVLEQDVIQSLATRESFDPSEPIRSIAVLPLDDFSAGGDQEYFAAGMHEELIARLSMLEGVRVVSRTTVMRYDGTTMSIPEIGRELGVDVVLEGSVNRSGNRVRITLQVIHAASDSHITTLQFDREAGDVLTLQTEVAHAVVHEIQGAHEEATFTLAAAEVAPAAQEAYFRGKHEYERGTTEGYRAALDYFQDALAIDSAFAPAMAGLAGARFLLGMADPVAGAAQLVQAREEAISALAMDTTSIESREVLDVIDRSLPGVLPAGSATVVEAPQVRMLAPDGARGGLTPDMRALDTMWVSAMTGLGQRIERQMMLRVAGEQPTDLGRQAAAARQLMTAGRYAEAVPVLEGLLVTDAATSPVWDLLARAYVGSGNAGAAAEAVRRWAASGAAGAPSRQSASRLSEGVSELGAAGYWTWRLEELAAAEEAGRDVPRTDLAAAHAALGRADEALALLSEALERRERGLFTLHTDPVWDEMRGDRRFREIERQAQFMRFAPAATYMGRRGRPEPR